VGGAVIERRLEDAILFRLTRLSKSQWEGLFGENAPLGTFSAKIKLGYAMRLYGLRTQADLNHIREIRNIFAHSERPITFATKRIKDLCAALHTPKRWPPDDSVYIRPAYSLFRLTIDAMSIELSILVDPRRVRRPRLRRPRLP